MVSMVHKGFGFAALAFGTALLPAQEAASKPAGKPREKAPVLVETSESITRTIGRYLDLGARATAVDAHWMGGRWQDVVETADDMIATDAKDHHGHALKYLALLELKRDRPLASQAAFRATKDLAASPKAMVEFLNRALYVRPRFNEYQVALMALVPLVAEAPEVASVRAAHIRALVGCGKVKEALITARILVKDLAGSTDDLLALVQGICDCDAKRGKALGVVARQAFDQVRKTRQPDRAMQMLEYRILHDFEGNQKAAHELGVKIVAEVSTGGLNNWLWYLMTRRSTGDRYPSLALIAARRLIQEDPSSAALDTIALALFKNGLLDEALDFQQRAVKGLGGGVSLGRQRRLGIFRAAKAKRDKLEAERKAERKPTKRDR